MTVRQGRVSFDPERTGDSFKVDGKVPEQTVRRFVALELRSEKARESFMRGLRSSPEAEHIRWDE